MSHGQFSPYEFALVIGVAFGWSIISSVASFYYGQTVGASSSGYAFGPSHLYGVVIFELIVGPVVATILYARGWRLKDFPLGIANVTTLIGVGIFVVAWMLGYVFTAALHELFSTLRQAMDAAEPYRPAHVPGLFAITLLSVVNPVFEEVIICGYVIPAIDSRFGTTTAVNVSAIIRGSYHLYQGIIAAPFHFSYGLIQAYVYVKFRRLWPLIVSHTLLDFVALLFLT